MLVGDGVCIEQFDCKGMVNNKFNYFIMSKLVEVGIFIQMEVLFFDIECLVKKLDMVLVECVVCNCVVGLLVKCLGIEEGIELNLLLFDLFLKNDVMYDLMVNDFYCEIFGWVSKENLVWMCELIYKVNDVLKKLFDDVGLILVDFKLEFGLFKGEVVLGDEFLLDGSCLWDKNIFDKMDKDCFCQSFGGLIEVYEEVVYCLGVKFD